ncbi:hypothetical protein DL89DRAFT_268777 [Linderina pennispora]|uniref:Exosome complex protein n=1 Tax=Linderina pennispora TaxID=61395 RepID=A0A1Y1W4D1_9FUNG|nr:uncharacterized protein DL89DRAFT_268777 [Linderina pennispora]ORX68278.1 hypothetical protein DL89DRAFT_268777 [Linderina pennispora]
MSDAKVQKSVDKLSAELARVEASLQPILGHGMAELLPKLTALQRCELSALVAYSIETLFWIYMKANGVPPKEHPVMKELQRIQRHMAKIDAAKGTAQAEKRPMQLDKTAAERFIRSGTGIQK